ncbi:MAG: hypothetical protein ACJ76H_14400 [Bacteriovoracaceae bacterium]
MKIPYLFSALSLILLLSCGKANDKKSTQSGVTLPAIPDAEDAGTSRYLSLDLEANSFYEQSYQHSLRIDIGRRPVVIFGNFSSTANCYFEVTLSDEEANKLETATNGIKFCSARAKNHNVNSDIQSTQAVTATLRSGKVVDAFKDTQHNSGINQTWVCGGKDVLYQTLNSVMAGKIPASCPADAMTKF